MMKTSSTPIVSLNYVRQMQGSYISNDAELDDYVFYKVKEKIVKVNSIEILRDTLSRLQLKIYQLEEELNEKKN